MMPMIVSVTLSTIGLKALPIMTATARSMTLPWEMNFLKPLSMGDLSLCVRAQERPSTSLEGTARPAVAGRCGATGSG